ncbi:MAG TPA: Do family serine endopeptidase [Methylomirabilota bacterium]|nr:Do family serine endopeptidase [Methylomirabilota bacterium]
MKVTTRVARFAWPVLALLTVVLLVAVSPPAGFGRDAQRLWSERGTGAPAVATVPAPNWVEIARAVKPAVVNVSTRGMQKTDMGGGDMEDFFRHFGGQAPQQHRMVRGLGSGFVINAGGYILTNNHVVDGASDIRVKFSDGRELAAKVVGRDDKTDVALIKVDASGLPVIPLGDSSKMEVGEPVLAVGNPFGLEQTVTTGIVSATGRTIGEGPYDDFIQTDASINPGNSGGPLVNGRGEAIGINTAIVSGSGGSVGIGFAIPTNLAKPVVTQLAQNGHVVRGWLGVSIQQVTPDLAKGFGLGETRGALVSAVMDNSPAQKAGVKAGDVITRYDNRPVGRWSDLPRVVAETPVGRDVPIDVVRNGKPLTLNVKVARLEEHEAQASAAEPASNNLGIAARSLTPALAQQLGVDASRGVLVEGVEDGGRAQTAGLERGDVIVEVDHQPVTGVEGLQQALKRHAAGTPVLMLVRREGRSLYLAVPAA